MMSNPELIIEDRNAVAEALDLFPLGRDFADVLIGVLNRRAGCDPTYTFDRGAAAMADITAGGDPEFEPRGGGTGANRNTVPRLAL